MATSERVLTETAIYNLPAAAATILEEFLAALLQTAGPQLLSVVLFGSAAEGRLKPNSDINLLVITDHLSLSQLDKVRTALRVGRAVHGLTVMFLERAELSVAAESFALKFSDIKARHRLLYGRSLFEEMIVPRDAAIRRLQQVLLNLQLRLRERYVIDGDHEEQLAQILADATGTIRASAATFLTLRGEPPLAPKLALETLFVEPGWNSCIRGLSAVHRDDRLPPGRTRDLYAEVLRLLAVFGEAVGEL